MVWRAIVNLKELEYLIAVDDERHFHRAAEKCFVSQPTLSGQLKKLSMTEVGKEVALRARTIIAGVKEIKTLAQNYHDPMLGELRVGIIPTIAPYLLPIIMSPLNKHFPNMKIWLYEYQTHVLLEKLRNADLDCLILALPIEKHEFVEQDLFREPFRLAVKKGEKLAKQKFINMSDIAHQELLLLEEGHCLREHVLDACVLAGVKEKGQYQATSLETLRHMIGEGMGMTLMPELAVPSRTTKSDSVRYLEFSDPKPNRRIGMLYRKNSYREEMFDNISELIKTALPVNVFF